MAASSNADLTAELFCFNIGRLSKYSQFCLTTAIVLGFFLIYGYFLVSYAGSFHLQNCDTSTNITPFGIVFAQIAEAYLHASIAKYQHALFGIYFAQTCRKHSGLSYMYAWLIYIHHINFHFVGTTLSLGWHAEPQLVFDYGAILLLHSVRRCWKAVIRVA